MPPYPCLHLGSRRGVGGARLVRAALVAMTAMALVQCDDEGPPPTTAHDVAAAAPAPEAAPEPTPVADESSPGADGDYAVGEDPDSYDDADPAALTDFRGALAPYGAWADDPTYGTVWTPAPDAVGPDFQPYVSAGHWLHDDDWVWASDYPWGWVPFHYGRWVFIEGRGWAWIPGRVYRGAWVEWSVDDGYAYVGWAPLPPAFVWFGGYPVPWRGRALGPRWAYCPRAAVFAPVLATHVMVGAAAAPIAPRMRIYATAGRVAMGPPPERLGFSAAQIPRPVGPAGASIARAQQFARPSTAQPLGARPPLRPGFAPGAAPVSPRFGGAPFSGGRGAVVAPAPRLERPGGAVVAPAGRVQGPAPSSPGFTGPRAVAPAPRAPVPSGGGAPRGGGGFGPSGGGFHGGGGAHFGGGGHHR